MVVRHKGYVIVQAENLHVMVIKDGTMCMHSQQKRPLSVDELKGEADRYIAFRKRRAQG